MWRRNMNRLLKGINIVQKEENGILGGPQEFDVEIKFNDNTFFMNIYQSIYRKFQT